MPVGRITNTNDRGFAFLKADTPPFETTFVHYSQLEKAGVFGPRVGQAFAYSVVPDERSGRTKAVDVECLDAAEV